MSKSVRSITERIIYPQSIPPRILHSSAHKILDPTILNLIALICREHVLPWYNSISKDPNRDFIQQITKILIHLIQTIELRLDSLDLIELLLIEVVEVLQNHYEDWDKAELNFGTGIAHNLTKDEIFEKLQPHLAITIVAGVPVVDKFYLRVLVDHLLRLLLPLEDFRAETEKEIIKELVVNIILGGVFDNTAQPWSLYGIIARVMEGLEQDRLKVQEERARNLKVADLNGTIGSRLDRALAQLGALPSIISAGITSIAALYHSARASPLSSKQQNYSSVTAPLLSLILVVLPPSTLLTQSVHYLSLPLEYCSTFCTSLVVYLMGKVLNTDMVEISIKSITSALFPNGHPPSKVPDPDREGKELLKIRCEEAIARILPLGSRKVFHLELNEVAQHIIRPLSSHVANVHLFVTLIDLFVGRLFPELVQSGSEQN